MKVLFIGSTKRGYLTLKALIENEVNVAGIISLEQDKHEFERFEEPIQNLAEKQKIPLRLTKWMKDADHAKWLTTEIQPDVAFVVGCRIMIPQKIYLLPPKGMLAVHDSLLPEYRGFAPLNWAILNGEDHTGVTLFHLSEAVDSGDIVAQRRIAIGPDDTAPQVYERVCDETIKLILASIPSLANGTAPRLRQDPQAGSFTCSRAPADGWIDWNTPTTAIYNKVRALTYPYPGAFTAIQQKKLWIWSAKRVRNSPRYVGRIPGRVVQVSADGHVDVLTADGVLRITEVQREGEAKSAAAQVIKSVRTTLGLSVADLLERP